MRKRNLGVVPTPALTGPGGAVGRKGLVVSGRSSTGGPLLLAGRSSVPTAPVVRSVRDVARDSARGELASVACDSAIKDAIEARAGKYSIRVACVVDKTASTIGIGRKMSNDCGRLVDLLREGYPSVQFLPVVVRGGSGEGGVDVSIGNVDDAGFFAREEHMAYANGSPLGYGVVEAVNTGFFALKGDDSRVIDVMVVLGDAYFGYNNSYNKALESLRDGGAVYAGFYQTAYNETGLDTYIEMIVNGSGAHQSIVVEAGGDTDPIDDIVRIIGVAARNRASKIVQDDAIKTFGPKNIDPSLFATSSLASALPGAVTHTALGGKSRKVRALGVTV